MKIIYLHGDVIMEKVLCVSKADINILIAKANMEVPFVLNIGIRTGFNRHKRKSSTLYRLTDVVRLLRLHVGGALRTDVGC